jgi:predicted nucleic acid-binding protein
MPGAEALSSAVLDASIVVAWLVPESRSESAAKLLANPTLWLAPRLLAVEVAAALRRKVVEGLLRVEFATRAIEILQQSIADGALQLAEDETLIAPALSLALTLDHNIPDCVYLALAEREGVELATADRVLARLARKHGIPVRFVSP